MAILNQKSIVRISKFTKHALFICLFFHQSIAAFDNAANSSAIYINADSLVLNKNTQTARYDGVVIVWFDDIVIKTSLLTIEYEVIDGKQKVKRILMPNRLTGLRNADQTSLIANSAVYLQDKSELTLEGDVKSSYGNYILKTDKLLYYTKFKNIANNDVEGRIGR